MPPKQVAPVSSSQPIPARLGREVAPVEFSPPIAPPMNFFRAPILGRRRVIRFQDIQPQGVIPVPFMRDEGTYLGGFVEPPPFAPRMSSSSSYGAIPHPALPAGAPLFDFFDVAETVRIMEDAIPHERVVGETSTPRASIASSMLPQSRAFSSRATDKSMRSSVSSI